MPDIKGTLFWLAVVLALLLWLLKGCGGPLDRFRDFREQRRQDWNERRDDWRQEREQRGSWRDYWRDRRTTDNVSQNDFESQIDIRAFSLLDQWSISQAGQTGRIAKGNPPVR